MKVIVRDRGMGKTTELIRMSHESGCYIVCGTRDDVVRTFHQAQEMGLDIHFPLTYEEFLKRQYHTGSIKGLLIDDVDRLIQHIAVVHVNAISVTGEGIT